LKSEVGEAEKDCMMVVVAEEVIQARGEEEVEGLMKEAVEGEVVAILSLVEVEEAVKEAQEMALMEVEVEEEVNQVIVLYLYYLCLLLDLWQTVFKA
jgi:hypothetical protein